MPNKTAEDDELIKFLDGGTDYKKASVKIKDGPALFTYDLSMEGTSKPNNNSTPASESDPKTHEVIPGIITVKDNNSDITDGFEKVDVKAAGLPEQEMNNVKFQGYKQNTEFFGVVKANYIKQSDLPPNTDVKKLQNYLTIKLGVTNPPIELKDGKFGPQTLEALAKVYNNALKEGDTATIEGLSTLMNYLSSKFQGTKIGETLSKLSQQGTNLIETKAKVEADLNKAVEIASKSKDMTFEEGATQINNLKNIPEGTQLEFMKKVANNKAQQYINEETLSNKEDAEKLLKAASTADGKSNGILDETTFAKLKEKVEGKKEEPKEEPKVEDPYAVTEQEKPHVDALSSLVTSPVKKGELKGRDHVDALTKDSSPRAQAVESAFRALYHTTKGSDETWKYSPNKESVGDVLKNKDIVKHLTADELKTLVNVYIEKGAKSSDLKEVFNSLDPKVAAKVMEGLKDGDNKDILLAMKPEDAGKILDNMEEGKLLKTFNEIGSGDWFFNIGDKTKEMGKILDNMSTEKVVKLLPKIKEEDPQDLLQAMTKEKAVEVLKAMENKDSGKILSNIGRDAKAGEFVAEVAKSDPKKAAEILNSMDKQKAEDVFEEVAVSDPKTWGSILAELEKIAPEKAKTFFKEIDGNDGKSSDLIKSQVHISKLIYLAEKGEYKDSLKGTEYIDRLRNSGNDKDKELVKEFEKHYEGKVQDGVVVWSPKAKTN
jgi:flagellar motility protein MotE (MotC chaperone)